MSGLVSHMSPSGVRFIPLHEIVLLDPSRMVPPPENAPPDFRYAQRDFVLASEPQKMLYLLAQIVANYRDKHDDLEAILIQLFFIWMPSTNLPVEREQLLEWLHLNAATMSSKPPLIDSQNRWYLGRYQRAVIEALALLFLSPRVIIISENGFERTPLEWEPAWTGMTVRSLAGVRAGLPDSGPEDESLPPDHPKKQPLLDTEAVRHRLDGYLWTMTGSRLQDVTRLWLLAPDLQPPLCVRGSVPYGVDLRISGSGQMADARTLGLLYAMFTETKVETVNLVGDEPTDHPLFDDVVRTLRLRGRPRFVKLTTTSSRWLASPLSLKVVQSFVAQITVPCQTEEDICVAAEIKRAMSAMRPEARPRVVVRHVVGKVSSVSTIQVVSAAAEHGLKVVMGGDPDAGKAASTANGSRSTDEALITLAMSDPLRRFAISLEAEAHPFHPYLRDKFGYRMEPGTGEERRFTCYIDAATGKMGPSMDAPPALLRDLPTTPRDFSDIYMNF